MRYLWTFLVAAVIGLMAAYAQAQNAKYYQAEGPLPEVVNIKRTMPDSARVCIEPPYDGLAICRSVGEVRKWMLERQQAK